MNTLSEINSRVAILLYPPALKAGSNRLFQAFDLYWRSPESGNLWYRGGGAQWLGGVGCGVWGDLCYRSRQLKKMVCPPTLKAGGQKNVHRRADSHEGGSAYGVDNNTVLQFLEEPQPKPVQDGNTSGRTGSALQ